MIHPKLQEALKEMYAADRLEYYSVFFGFFDFVENNNVPTMYVTMKNLRLVLGYNREFVERYDMAQLKYLLLHEYHHVGWNIFDRLGKRDKRFSNTVHDCIINHVLDTEFKTKRRLDGSEVTLTRRPTLHEDDFKDPLQALALMKEGLKVGDESGCRIDPEYLKLVQDGKKLLAFEPLYEWMEEKQKNGPPSFDEHTDLSEQEAEIMKQLVKEVKEKAKQISRGAGLNDRAEGILETALKQSKNNYLKEVQKIMASMRGTVKEPSYRRPSRKVPELKGNKKIGHALTILHDWSGSMSGEHEKVLNEIYRDGYTLDFVGADVGVAKVFKVTRKAQLKSIPFNGNGGTCLQPAIDQIASDTKLNRNPLVVLTDGMTDTLCFDNIRNKVIILTVGTPCPIQGREVKQIVLKND